MGRRLTTEIPEDVWDRLAAEAESHGKKIGTYIRDLIVARDERRNKKQ